MRLREDMKTVPLPLMCLGCTKAYTMADMVHGHSCLGKRPGLRQHMTKIGAAIMAGAILIVAKFWGAISRIFS